MLKDHIKMYNKADNRQDLMIDDIEIMEIMLVKDFFSLLCKILQKITFNSPTWASNNVLIGLTIALKQLYYL